MNGRRAKWIRKQLMEGNAAIFLAVRMEMGSRTENMTPRNIYKTAKRIWAQGKADQKLWKKGWKFDQFQNPMIQKPIQETSPRQQTVSEDQMESKPSDAISAEDQGS